MRTLEKSKCFHIFYTAGTFFPLVFTAGTFIVETHETFLSFYFQNWLKNMVDHES